MGYQVLARKWRPGSFNEMVGQEHVLKALVNALDNDRLHHAYLFTGTRGVGKTTIARILAKCLNCEQGVSSVPCGTCSACTEVAEGRFVDLIEVDAASKTKIDDTREMLDNVQYAPTRGRYKVYLIDEVHMLSGHSFNALLKTLEEPPPHVKFLLATTDPQKLPVTILSRCLQFNLKNLTAERIVKHLIHVLEEEKIPAEESALWALSRSADGSMRDALSLTDQAIAHGNGTVTESEVAAMLGTINLSMVNQIAAALTDGDISEVLHQIANMAEFSPDYPAALADLLSLWHRVAIYQAMPDAVDNSFGDLTVVAELAAKLSREDVQLFYQIGLLARKDLPLAPDPRSGFEMAMLRMVAFRPQIAPVPEPVAMPRQEPELQAVAAKKPEAAQAATPQRETPVASQLSEPVATEAKAAEPVTSPRHAQAAVPTQTIPLDSRSQSATEQEQLAAAADKYQPDETLSSEQLRALSQTAHQNDQLAEPSAKQPIASSAQEPAESSEQTTENNTPQAERADIKRVAFGELNPANYQQYWIAIYQHLKVGGLLQNTAANLVLVEVRDKLLRFELDKDYSALYDAGHNARLAETLSEYFEQQVTVDIEVGVIVGSETPQAYRERIIREKRAAAIVLLKNDPNIQMLEEVFDAELIESSVKPVD